MNHLIFKLQDNFYREKGNNDQYLSMLSEIFDEGTGWTNSVKRALTDPNRKGVTGNKTEVEINGNVVKIYPQFVYNPEEFEIEIDRYVLLGLIDEWLELVAKKSPEIYFIRYDDGRLEIKDHLPAQ